VHAAGDIAAALNITERSAHGIVTDLTAAGYVVRQKDSRSSIWSFRS
jgi:DNA-binding IclR family transcriptional regulator